MRIPTSNRPWAALLVVLLSLAWGIRDSHAWWLHQQTSPVCDQAHDGQTPHLHDAQDQEHPCPICAFCFAIPNLLSITSLLTPALAMPDSILPGLPDGAPTLSGHDTVQLRGPPLL